MYTVNNQRSNMKSGVLSKIEPLLKYCFREHSQVYSLKEQDKTYHHRTRTLTSLGFRNDDCIDSFHSGEEMTKNGASI